MMCAMSDQHRHADWSTARNRILQRMAELRLTPTDVIRASGLSDKHVRTLLNDGPEVSVPRESTRWALCDALQWTQDSIDRILNGEEPVVAVTDDNGEVSPFADLSGRLDEIGAQVSSNLEILRHQDREMEKYWRLQEELQGEVRAAAKRLDAVEKAIAELRRPRRRGGAEKP